MKRKLLFTTMIAFCGLYVKAQWNAKTSGTTSTFYSIYCTDANTCYAACNDVAGGGNGVIRKTTNAGSTWLTQKNITNDQLMSVFFVNATTGFVCGNNGAILKTTDGGTTWTTQTSGTTNQLNEIFFLNASTGFAVGGLTGNDLLKTTDGGTTWTSITQTATSSVFNGIYFPSATTGFAVAGSYFGSYPGAIIKTTDGGTTWTLVHSSTTVLYNKIYCTDVNNCIAVGSSGEILRTIDGGTNWNIVTSGTTRNLLDVYFTSATTGYIAGGFQTILKTTNGGSSWLAQTAPANALNPDFNSVCFPGTNTGFIGGMWGTVLATTNGGTSSTGIENNNYKGNEATIYPNPFTTSAILQTPALAGVNGEFLMYDVFGRQVQKTIIRTTETEIQRGNLSNGIYFYQLKKENEIINSGKIIIE